MSEPFTGEVRMFAGNFAPMGWALCDGQLLAVSQNNALFSLLGTIYGGDGRTTYGIPDLRGRIPIHAGSGPGLTTRRLGAKGGSETVTVSVNQLPAHSHNLFASSAAATTGTATDNVSAATTANAYATSLATSQTLNSAAVSQKGGSSSHTNLMPTLCVNFIIALYGIYPSRT